MKRYLYSYLLLACLIGCAVQPIARRSDADAPAERDAQILTALRELGRNGDWLVARGYHVTDNMVASLTNMPFSHAAVLDRDSDQVIEAESVGVHTTPLAQFVAKSQRVMLVRPVWADASNAMAATVKARSLVGRPYDFLGLVGVSVPDEYYCSELAIEIYRPFVRREDIIPRPVAPGQLHYWGRIVFDSGAR
jgi:uncharacterized protein YycO